MRTTLIPRQIAVDDDDDNSSFTVFSHERTFLTQKRGRVELVARA